jgi:heme exporter protein B
MTSFRAMIQRELRLSLRGGGDALTLVLFFVMVRR